MPIALKYQKNVKTNTTGTFDFGSDSVVAYCVGILYWNLSFGGDDHHVKTMSIQLNTNQPTTSQVTFTVNAVLQDDSGHTIDNSNSSVSVAIVANTTSRDSNFAFANANSINNGSQSGPIALPSSSLSIGSAFLSGLDLSYGSDDHHVKTVQTTAGFNYNGSNGEITSQAQMIDDSGNNASTASINGGLVAASSNASGLLVRAATDKQTTSAFDVEFGQQLKDSVPLLQNLLVSFGGDDHHVKSIGGGCTGWKTNGSKVTMDNAMAFISDDSGNTQNNSDSKVSMIVLGIPA